MKSPLSAVVAIVVGLLTLIAYFLRTPELSGVLNRLLSWAIILAGIATLIGIMNLLSVHWRRVRAGWFKLIYSMVTILAFVATLLLGIVFVISSPQEGLSHPLFVQGITTIQVAAEGSLMAVLSVSLAYAALQLIRRRSANLLSVTFIISALVFLLLNIGFLTSANLPFLKEIAAFLNRLPIAGSRGLLIGVALGSLTAGLRILLGTDRPYGG
jgi:hypothetical protein